ncbi:MAG: ATP-binding cassette domain-containing protein [Ignavibacteria bacterium]|nr:ATP-binding cassette domain-containing protein [Ignavibacteria bacterium]
MFALEVNSICKSFKEHKAVDNISFAVEKGKIFGILGPNGAGKTTTIRMIAGVFFPDEGEISVLGERSVEKIQHRIGYLPEERGLYKKMKVIDQLVYFAELKGTPNTLAKQKARLWLNKLDAKDWENKKVQELSKGMQQKIQFLSTLLHEPDLLILDEPFSGFDPINVEIFKNVLLDLKAEGKTILLSTHIMEQAEQLCDDVCLINKGKVILKGSIADIKSTRSADTVICEFYSNGAELPSLTNVKILNRTQNRLEFRFNPSEFNIRDFIKELADKVEIKKFEITTPSLREIFIDEVTKGEK